MNPSEGRGRRSRRKSIYGRRRTGSQSYSPGGRPPRNNRYIHIVFGVVAVAVVLFIFTRDDSDPVEATTTTVGQTLAATTETTRTPGDTTLPTETTAVTAGTGSVTSTPATTTTTTPEGEPQPPVESATAYVDGLAEVKAILAELASELSAASRAWDNRDDSGALYKDTESTISGVVDRTRSLEGTIRNLPVPSSLVGRHEGAQGPVGRAAGLVPLAEAVLEGLRIPSPDDGSTRRTAVAGFVSAAEAFIGSVDDLIRHVEENAEDLGLVVAASPTTTTTSQPPRELSDEALSYVNGLRGFKEVLSDLVARTSADNQAWDNTRETGFTYRETTASLNDTIDRARSFHEQVRGLPVPESVGPLGDGPIQHAARLPALAEAILAGLRLPAPEDGSVRRAALADFVAAADDFANSVDNLVTYIDENAVSLGLLG